MENANPPPTNNPHILPTALRARVVQELNELQTISTYIDSRLDNINQFLNGFTQQPNEINVDDLELDDESVDTPLVYPFLDSDDDSDDGEVLNELEEYGNAGQLCRQRAINSFDGDDLAFQYIFMSDSEDSTATYMEVSSPFEDLSDIGSPGVVVHGYDGLPMMPEDPYAFVEAAVQEPPPLGMEIKPVPDGDPIFEPFLTGPVYPDFMPPEDDVLPAEEQPLPAAVSPTADSPGYIIEFDLEEDPEEDQEEDDEDEEEQEEHLAPADSVPPPAHRTTARTPPLLPIPLPTSSPPLLLPSIDHRAGIPEVELPPRKRLCIAPGPRFEIRESSSAPTARPTRGFRRDYGFVATLDDEIRRDLDREIGYRITDVWEDTYEIAKEIPVTDVAELGQRMIDFVTTIRQDTDEIYGQLDKAHDARSVMSGQLNMLCRDRRSLARTARLMEAEARASREAWTQMATLQSQQRPTRDSAHPDVSEEAGSSS
ncbi:hypothetical protein Tco_1570599 [Tanacetum coccineum]